MNRFHVDGSSPKSKQIFVFGSNLSGIHGGGAAKAAHREYGAIWGVAEGLMGHAYGIPTVQKQIAGPLKLDEIRPSVDRFLVFATDHPNLVFFVTRIGCGLAGHKDSDIASMFVGAPGNCSMPDTWYQHLGGVPA